MRKEAKRTRSRIIAFLLTVCMTLSLMPTAFVASAADFADVPSTAWYYDSVDYVVQHKYFEGTGENTFSPTTPMTRAMFVTVLARLDGAEVDDTVSAFDDVVSGSWYAGAVAWAVENEIANGVGSNNFAPAQNVTRQDMASFMARYIEYYTEKNKVTLADGEHSKTFTDDGMISFYAKEAVALCVAYGLIDGYPDGGFQPQDTASRSQVAAVIHRLAVLLETGLTTKPSEEIKVFPALSPSGGGKTTVTSNDNKTAADFEKAAEKSGDSVTAGIDKENSLTGNDDVTIDVKAGELTLDLNTASLGKLTINATSENPETTKIVINGDAASVQSLTINAPYATVENKVQVKGPVHIEAVSLNTFVNRAATGIITISGKGAVEDLQGDPSEIVVNTSSEVAVKGNSTAIKIVADNANLTVATTKAPTVESSAAAVELIVNTKETVTIEGTISKIEAAAEAPTLAVNGTVESITAAEASTIKVKGTGSISTMETGKANVIVPDGATLSVEKVEAKGGSITAPANTVNTVKVEADANLKLNAPVETVAAAAGATLQLEANATVKTVEAEGSLTLAGSGEVTSIDVKTDSAVAPAQITIQDAGLTVTQVTKTNPNATVNVTGTSEKIEVVTKAAKPTEVSFKAPTTAGGDGKLTNVTDKMEYKGGNITSYTEITLTDSALSVAPGTYQVRVAADATDNVLASEPVTVTIPAAVGVKNAEIQGTPYVGSTLTAVANADVTGKLKYEWKANGSDAVIGTAKTLKLTDDYIGKTITVRIYNYGGQTATTDATQNTATSTATAVVTVDKSTLNKLLDKAAEIRNGVTVKADGTTASAVAEGVAFVTTSEKDSLTSAINNATTVKDSATATSTQVANAENALRSANDAFIKAKKTGTRNDVTVLKQDLAAMLGTAPAAANNNGSKILIKSNAEEVAPGVQWVTQAAADAYSKVKTEAEQARDNSAATKEQLSAAITKLTAAITTYLKAIQKGAELDNSALLAAINAAEINAASVEVSSDGSDVLPSKTWVVEGNKTAYTSAIRTARNAAAAAATTTQSDYNSALDTLNGATSTFNAAKKVGTKDIIAPVVTNVTVTLNGTTATVSFTSSEAGTYTYQVNGGNAKTSAGAAVTAGTAVTFTADYPSGSSSITVTVKDNSSNTTEFTVKPSRKVVQIIRNDKALEPTYETLAKAIKAAQNGDTVRLLKSVTLPSSGTVTVPTGVTLEIASGATLKMPDQMSDKANNPSVTRILTIASGADLVVNGTFISGTTDFSDIEQLGTMTINAGANMKLANGNTTYFGADGLATLGEGAKVVSVPKTEGTYTGGCTYTLTGSATLNGLAVTGSDTFVVGKGATLIVSTAEDLQKAIEWTDGGTIKLLENIGTTKTFVFEKDATLDLGGFTLTGNGIRAIQVKSETLTLTGTGTVTSTGSIALDSSVIRVGDGSTKTRTNVAAGLILGEKVTVAAPASYGVTAFGDTTETVTIYGTVSATAAPVNESYDGCAVATNGSIASDATINIEDGAVITATSTNAIYMPSGTLNVKGGTITGTTGIYAKSATVNVTGGTITGDGTSTNYQHYGNGGIPTGDAFVVDSCGYPGTVSVKISGGSFTSTKANAVGSYAGNNVTTAAAGFITGGTFSSDPTSYLAHGYKAEEAYEDGSIWTVSKMIWSDYPAAPADVSQMPSGVKITSLGNEDNQFKILLEDEEAFLYFTQKFDRAQAYEARKAAGEAGKITKYDAEKNCTNLNMWYGAYTSGITVKMGCDVDLKGMTVSTVKFGGNYGPNFDGDGHTISNARMEATAGNIGFFNGNISVSNVTFDNFTVSAIGCENAAVVVGYPTGATTYAAITNVTVKNSSVTGGRMTGAIAGHLYGADVNNCKVENTIVCGQYKVGGIAGQTSNSVTIDGNTLKSVTVKGDGLVSDKEGFVLGKILGCWANTGVDGSCKDNSFDGTISATANIGKIYNNRKLTQN